MSEYNDYSDILVEVPDEDLEELADIYRSRSYMPHASSLLKNGHRLRRQGCFFIQFLSPRNCWKKDGTFFALMEFPPLYQLSIFTMDESGESVYQGLMNTKRIDFNKNLEFEAIPHIVYSTVMRVIDEKKLNIENNNQCFIYTVPQKVARNFQMKCPNHLEIRRLEISQADFMNSIWPHRSPGSEKYVTSLIETCGGYGLFIKSTNELVSWILKKKLGEIGLLQTVDHHKRKGFGSIILKKMSKEVAEDGENPTGIVSVSNEASIKLLEKEHFENLGWCYYIKVNGKK
ncbi:uncharacterized protein [Leptinotarsa decemlineata]|uniref:uncharacterized protein n=1 Tax=Leptinotarsa decemlineata TaxID=7539 RepID=UPI003D3071F5